MSPSSSRPSRSAGGSVTPDRLRPNQCLPGIRRYFDRSGSARYQSSVCRIVDRRSSLAEAGLTGLATEGARGLTHRAVDRVAGVAEGSTSYYFRTRAELLTACAERLAIRTMQSVGPPPAAQSDVDDLIELAVRSVHAWTADGGLMILARHELLLESARHADLRRQIDAATENVRMHLERRVEQMDVPDAAERATDLILPRRPGLGARRCSNRVD
jgi:DNA-binding transcriptional regulator YbjK